MNERFVMCVVAFRVEDQVKRVCVCVVFASR